MVNIQSAPDFAAVISALRRVIDPESDMNIGAGSRVIYVRELLLGDAL